MSNLHERAHAFVFGGVARPAPDTSICLVSKQRGDGAGMVGADASPESRLDASTLLERVLGELGQDELVEPLLKAAGTRSGSSRVTQLRRALAVHAVADGQP